MPLFKDIHKKLCVPFLVFGFIRCREPYAFVEGETDNKSTFTDTILLTNLNAQFTLFINNMFVTLLSSTCFEH